MKKQVMTEIGPVLVWRGAPFSGMLPIYASADSDNSPWERVVIEETSDRAKLEAAEITVIRKVKKMLRFVIRNKEPITGIDKLGRRWTFTAKLGGWSVVVQGVDFPCDSTPQSGVVARYATREKVLAKMAQLGIKEKELDS